MIKKQLKGSAFLLCAALIWGLSFVFQSEGLKSVDTFTFNGLRLILGGIVLLPVIAFNERKSKKSQGENKQKESNKNLLIGGIVCGVALCVGTNLQQHAFHYSPVGKVGFITALYMLLVPLFGLFLGKKVRLITWLGVAMGVAGLYLMCITDSFNINTGDILTFICAIFFAIHILAVGHFVSSVDAVKLSCVQFLVAGTISVILMFIFETPKISGITETLPGILYAGIMSCGVAFTFQSIGQRDTDPSLTAILLCLEAVFSAIFGALILNQTLSVRETAGCVVMFLAMILSQLPSRGEKAK